MIRDYQPALLHVAFFSVLTTAIGLFASADLAQAGPVNLVQNGEFLQTSTTSPGGYVCANTGGSNCVSQVADWNGSCATGGCTGTSTPSSVLFAGTDGRGWNSGYGLYWNGIGNAPLGGNAIGIVGDPTYTSILTQSITGLNAGQTYILQFYQAASQQMGLSGATTEQWGVSLGGGAAQYSSLMNTPSQGAHGWEQVTMSFVANATSELLKFMALGSPAGEPPVALLGDVSLESVNTVTEPSSLALAGAGLLALLVFRRNRPRPGHAV